LSAQKTSRDRNNTANSTRILVLFHSDPDRLFSVIGPSIRCIFRPFFSCLANFWREPKYVPLKHAPADIPFFDAIEGHSITSEVIQGIVRPECQNGSATIEGSGSESAAERESLVFHHETDHYFPLVQPTEIILYVQASFIKEATPPFRSFTRSGHGDYQRPGRRL